MATEEPYTIPVFPDDPDRLRMMVTDSKLGGYIVGGDVNTAAPSLWEWLVVEKQIKSMIDIGCGEGHALSYFRDRDCWVVGVDAIEQPDEAIHQHDYRVNSWVPFDIATNTPARFDLAWSCEFLEHVGAEHIPNFMATFQCADLALITHATPGQNGWNHVNCQDAAYWINVFDDYGFGFDQELTDTTRQIASSSGDWNYYMATGLAFTRRTA